MWAGRGLLSIAPDVASIFRINEVGPTCHTDRNDASLRDEGPIIDKNAGRRNVHLTCHIANIINIVQQTIVVTGECDHCRPNMNTSALRESASTYVGVVCKRFSSLLHTLSVSETVGPITTRGKGLQFD